MKLTTNDIALIALCTALIALTSWITIPFIIPVTLQLFTIVITLQTIGTKRGIYSLLIYILLGMVGLPIFSGGKGGIGIILGPTGGYIIGFLVMSLFLHLINLNKKEALWLQIIFCIIGLLICYAFGTAFYLLFYANGSVSDIRNVLCTCVLPFIIPDIFKIIIATLISKKIRKTASFLLN